MHREQYQRILIYLMTGAVCTVGSWWLATVLGIERLVWIAAAVGLGMGVVIVALYWRVALERAGFYGMGPERVQRYRISARAERLITRGMCGVISFVFLASWLLTGSKSAGLGCLLAVTAGLALTVGLAEAICFALTGAKWQLRERG